jgi:hypothetical protein
MRFRPGGAFASLVHTGRGGSGRGQFIRPQSLATDASGDLYIADPVANKVIVFGDDGRFSREWKVDHAIGVQVVGDLAYVSTGGEVHVFDRKGEEQGSFGRHGNGRGQLDANQGVEADARHVFVADALNERVVAFDRQGEVVWSLPDVDSARVLAARSATASAQPSGEGPFELPQDLTFDARGRLAVVDAFKFQLVVLDPATGFEIGRYGEYGTRDGAFFYPTGVAYDAKRDWFAVADTRNDRVQIVRIPGSGSDPASAVRRTLTSPYRYCLPPVLVALVALILAFVSAPRMPREKDGEGSTS